MNAASARRLYLHVLHGGTLTPEDVSRMVQYIERLEGKLQNSRCSCDGWGCSNCCSSEAEIRARQGTFG